jgi:hypothetical protein
MIIQEMNVSATATNAFLITEMKKKVWAAWEGVSEGENEQLQGRRTVLRVLLRQNVANPTKKMQGS